MRFNPSDNPQIIKRKLLALLGTLPFGTSFVAAAEDSEETLKRKFRGIAGVIVALDVAPDAQPREWVAVYTEMGRRIAAPSRLGPKGNQILAFTGGVLPVPKTVRVTWREGSLEERPRSDVYQGWVGGTIVGDYTIKVASRIPGTLLDYVRAASGRALRLKFRLKDDGVLFGWDVEERFVNKFGERSLRHVMPGGDFLNTDY